ncbi:MAG: PIN domain-containing protein [bacterium]
MTNTFMENRIFVDTSAWLGLNDKNDQYHNEAKTKAEAIKKERIELLTSEYIVDESITLIRYRISHQASVSFGDSLLRSKIAIILDVKDKDRFEAWRMFKKYKDKELSFTDCTSFVLMNERGIKMAFTFDKHFRQLGFKIF